LAYCKHNCFSIFYLPIINHGIGFIVRHFHERLYFPVHVRLHRLLHFVILQQKI
jgi:hypothetical protein